MSMQLADLPTVPTAWRNLRRGPSVLGFVDRRDGIVWEGAGHPGGLDIQIVPPDVVSSAAFVRACRLGIFEQVDDADPALMNAQQQQIDAAKARLAFLDGEGVAEIMDPGNDNDLVMDQCLG